tara:strand:- start:8644 stop:9027 length:384 start_codon:yes stop_codon:yes gene_type:complete
MSKVKLSRCDATTQSYEFCHLISAHQLRTQAGVFCSKLNVVPLDCRKSVIYLPQSRSGYHGLYGLFLICVMFFWCDLPLDGIFETMSIGVLLQTRPKVIVGVHGRSKNGDKLADISKVEGSASWVQG